MKKQAIEVFPEKGMKKQNPFRNTPSAAPRKRGKKYTTEATAQQLDEAVIPR